MAFTCTVLPYCCSSLRNLFECVEQYVNGSLAGKIREQLQVNPQTTRSAHRGTEDMTNQNHLANGPCVSRRLRVGSSFSMVAAGRAYQHCCQLTTRHSAALSSAAVGCSRGERVAKKKKGSSNLKAINRTVWNRFSQRAREKPLQPLLSFCRITTNHQRDWPGPGFSLLLSERNYTPSFM